MLISLRSTNAGTDRREPTPTLVPLSSIQYITLDKNLNTVVMLTNGEKLISSTSLDQIKKQVK